MKLQKAILDADICIKIGRFEKLQFLELIIPLIAEKVYIHKYVYEDEILTPKNAKIQIDNLIEKGIVEILDSDNLDMLNKQIYNGIVAKLKKYMVGTKEKGKNWGEVLSLSMSKVLEIPYFMSDEGDLQVIIDEHLNTGVNCDIKVFRVEDIIKWVKNNEECNIKRKVMKVLWVGCGKSKEVFDNKLWPIK